MNEERDRRKGEALAQLSSRGHSIDSSAWMISEIDIEEECITNLLLQKADIYLDAYERRGLKIGIDVLKDIAHSQAVITASRKCSLIGQAQLTAVRTNRPQNTTRYRHFGKKVFVTMNDIELKIDRYNMTPRKAERMTINNTTYHLSGVGNRVVHGDDNSVNVINEKELFDQLASVIANAVQDVTERQSILKKLEELKHETIRTDYLTNLTKFIAAAGSIAHVVGPYLPALMEKAASLL
jgi:hypothetical protein